MDGSSSRGSSRRGSKEDISIEGGRRGSKDSMESKESKGDPAVSIPSPAGRAPAVEAERAPGAAAATVEEEEEAAEAGRLLLQEFKKKFVDLDTDDDGYLNLAEVSALAQWVYMTFKPVGKEDTVSRHKASSSHQTSKLFHLLDLDEDGMVSYAEFEAYFKKTYGQSVRLQQAAFEAHGQHTPNLIEVATMHPAPTHAAGCTTNTVSTEASSNRLPPTARTIRRPGKHRRGPSQSQEMFLKASKMVELTGQSEEERVRISVLSLLSEEGSQEADSISGFVLAFRTRTRQLLQKLRNTQLERRRYLSDTAAACALLSSYKSGMADFAYRRVLVRVQPVLLEILATSPEVYDPWGLNSLPEILEQCLEEALMRPLQAGLIQATTMQVELPAKRFAEQVTVLRRLPASAYGLYGRLAEVPWEHAISKLDRFSSFELLPYEKLELLLEIVANIEALYANDVVEAAAEKGVSPEDAIQESPLSADDLLAVFTHLVVHTPQDQRLYCAVEYVKAICSNDLGPKGYYICVLASAVEFLMHVDLGGAAALSQATDVGYLS